MSENHDVLVLEYLRRLGAKMDAAATEIHDLRDRLTRAECQLAALAATEALHHAATTIRMDRLEASLNRIEAGPDAADRSAEA